MIVIPQDPGPLLQILPSPELRLDNVIKVFWLGKCPPANQDLKPFLSVRKDKVLMALHYLAQHNHLYRDIAINYAMIEDWSEEFIPTEIADNITYLEDPDHHNNAKDILLVFTLGTMKMTSMLHKTRIFLPMTMIHS